MADEIEVTILPDGNIKTETPGKISGANHRTAETFFQDLARAGQSERKRKSHGHQHTHATSEKEASH
jgi:hypothetical protein